MDARSVAATRVSVIDSAPGPLRAASQNRNRVVAIGARPPDFDDPLFP
jgi:hypothetical protein